MKNILTVCLLILTSFSVLAGDNGGGSLECVSASGRTKISATGVADYNGFGPLAIQVTIDNKTLELGVGQKNTGTEVVATGVTVFRPRIKVYTAVVNLVGEAGRYDYSVKALELVAIPTSMRQLPSEQFLFDATLNTIDPRIEQSGYPQMMEDQIQVRCRMDQSV